MSLITLPYTEVRTLVACTSSITVKGGANQEQTKLQSQSFILLPLCIVTNKKKELKINTLRILVIVTLKIYYHIGHLFYDVCYIHPLFNPQWRIKKKILN